MVFFIRREMGNLHLFMFAVLLTTAVTQIFGEIQNIPFFWIRNHNYIFFLLIANEITASNPKGRLLTPAEGCGYSRVAQTRIVGGTKAKIGKIKHAFLNHITVLNSILFREISIIQVPGRGW